VSGAGVELGIADPFDDDLIETDRRDDESRHWGTARNSVSGRAEIDQSRLAYGALRLGTFPCGAGVAARERATRVRRAGVKEQRAADQVQQRADATAHAA
jgi:hypothetical protein